MPAFAALGCRLIASVPVYYAPQPCQPVTYQPPPQTAPAYQPAQTAYPPAQQEAAGGSQTVVQEGGRSITLEHGPAGDPSIVGCTDGHREAFLDTQRYPAIAGCLGAWGGRQSLRAAPTGPPAAMSWAATRTGGARSRSAARGTAASSGPAAAASGPGRRTSPFGQDQGCASTGSQRAGGVLCRR